MCIAIVALFPNGVAGSRVPGGEVIDHEVTTFRTLEGVRVLALAGVL